jgi:CHAD domain-containing protein
VAAELGAVRDLDVMIENVEAYRAGLGADEATAMDPLLAVWRANRDAARVILLRELSSRRYQRWMESYAVFVETEGSGVRLPGPVEPHRVRDTMPSRIWAAYETLRGYEPVMRWADITTLHELRIAAKWLRYTLEFVREAMGPETTQLIEQVVALQDHLGWLHDAEVAAGLARAFLTAHTGSLADIEATVIGRYLADRERELARLHKNAGAPWEPLVAEPFRLMLGRVTASL